MPKLELQLLGPFRAALNGQPITVQIAGKLRALLAYLAVESGRAHNRETLAGVLWSDQPAEKALHSLRQALSSLRKILAEESRPQPRLALDSETVQFNPAPGDWLDVEAFQRLIETALQPARRQSGRGRVNVRLLQQASALHWPSSASRHISSRWAFSSHGAISSSRASRSRARAYSPRRSW